MTFEGFFSTSHLHPIRISRLIPSTVNHPCLWEMDLNITKSLAPNMTHFCQLACITILCWWHLHDILWLEDCGSSLLQYYSVVVLTVDSTVEKRKSGGGECEVSKVGENTYKISFVKKGLLLQFLFYFLHLVCISAFLPILILSKQL